MDTFYQILGLIGAAIVVWILYRYVKAKPEQLSRESLAKSFSTMGLLALVLIAFVALLIMLVRTT